jgi:WD40 repeat protein
VCGFPVITGGWVWSSPSIADLDEDGNPEIVAGSERYEKITLPKGLLSIETNTGMVYALASNGIDLPGFPKSLGSSNIYTPASSGIGYSSPIISDLNGDGEMEIAIGAEDGLYVLQKSGKVLPRFPRKTGGSLRDSFMAVGDLDGDKTLEIVSGAYDGRLYVWHSDGSTYPGFPIQTGGYIRQVTLGDIDGDGMQEILGGSSDNRVHAWKLDGTEVEGFPKVTMGDVETAPTLGDLEGDGSLELVVGSDDGGVYVWRISEKYGKLEWPMVRRNASHTGVR